MKNKMLTNSFRKIKSNFKRFISLLCMSLLGVGFFAGIKTTSPDMLQTLDKFYDEQNVFDIEVVSTLGLKNEDVEALQQLEEVDDVEGAYSKDELIYVDDQQYVIKLMSIPERINKPYLQEGRMPENVNEVVVENKFLRNTGLCIGNKIKINNAEVEIVGKVVSPLYFSEHRGTTSLGDGRINYYMYAIEDSFDKSYYTNIYVTVAGAKDKITNKNDYKEIVNNAFEKIENIIKIKEEPFRIGYIFDRTDNVGYRDLTDACENIENLGNVFPLVFYVIAVLISLISMMRMVEEDRTENGTLKALGYNSISITMKYVIYAILATVLGGIIGMIIGCNLIPNIIWNIYQMLFSIPYFVVQFNVSSGITGLLIAMACICGSAIFVSLKELRHEPSVLMRPKTPKKGKKVILEKIPFIWKRLSFSKKIIVRNIFRYKTRVLATIIGIAGCTALILAGFGLKDALKDIVTYQFDSVFHYDKMIALNATNDNTNIFEELESNENIKDIVKCSMQTVELKYKEKKQETILVVPENTEELNKAISLRNVKDNFKEIELEDDVIILGEKTSKLLNINENDTLLINDNYELKVKGIAENYINHYAYITKSTYDKIYNSYTANVYLITIDMTDEQATSFDEDFIKRPDVVRIDSSKDTIDAVTKMMNSLDSVVLVLIVSAALLAFVVLYNLSNINISERKREIATLKVLGFYNKEVDSYITKENIILTILGIAIGLFIGLYLSHYIISTCETQNIMFVRHINTISYVLSAIITIIFTVIVNIITHFNLKKIDMIDSLKNVE